MPTQWMNGIRFELPEDEEDLPLPSQLRTLERTTALVPEFHLVCVNRVEIRRPGQHPLTGGGNDHDNRIIRLSHVSFERDWNQDFHITFLHELGHLVDHFFQVTAYVQGLRTDDSRAYIATPHSHRDGGTNGPGERTADCYMNYIISTYGGVTLRSEHFAGRAGELRFNLLLSSPAFTAPNGTRRT
jgi:hypothetical protein